MMASMARDAAGSWRGLLVPGVILGSLPTAAGLAHRISQVDHRGLISFPFLDRSGSVHAARLKQHGLRFPPLHLGDAGLDAALAGAGIAGRMTHRTHSQRAIGVMSFHSPRIVPGAAARAA
jgi:hypothetical protein